MDASNGTEGAIREFQEDSMDFAEHDDNDYDDEKVATQMTCEMLCSLGGSCSSPQRGKSDSSTEGSRKKSGKSCPKQLQLPMFLSSKLLLNQRPTVPCRSSFMALQLGITNGITNRLEYSSRVELLKPYHDNYDMFELT